MVCQIVKWSARTVFLHGILFSDFAGNTRFIVLLTNAISVWLCSETQIVDQKEPWSKLTVVVSQIMMRSISPCQELQMLDTGHFRDKWNAIHQYLQNRNDYPFAYKENWYNLINKMNKIWIVFWQISTYDEAGKKWIQLGIFLKWKMAPANSLLR